MSLLLGFGTFENSSKMGRVLCCQQCYKTSFGLDFELGFFIKMMFQFFFFKKNRKLETTSFGELLFFFKKNHSLVNKLTCREVG